MPARLTPVEHAGKLREDFDFRREVSMKGPHRPVLEREVLPNQLSERLLARAAELDAAQRVGANIAELRAAAAEAGISPAAFDTALEELRGVQQAPAVPSPRRRPRIGGLALALLAVILVGSFAVGRAVVPPTIPTIEQAFLLRCLPVGEAAELVRPMLEPQSGMIMASPTRAPRVLTVRTTPEQMPVVRALLDRQDGAACQLPGTTR